MWRLGIVLGLLWPSLALAQWYVTPGGDVVSGGNVKVSIEVDNVGIGGGTQYAEDTLHVSGDTATLAGVVQSAACGTALSGAGDRSLLQVNATGELCVSSGTGLLTTTAHDAAFGTAGTADAQVRSVQGIASMTPLQVESNAVALATETTLSSALTALQVIDNAVATVSATTGYRVFLYDAADTQITGTKTDTEDASIASGQSGAALVVPMPYYYNGTAWIRRAAATLHTADSAASTNATNVKASAGIIRSIYVASLDTTPVYLTLYNNAGAPTCGTSVVGKILIPADASGLGNGASPAIPVDGWNFTTGIAYCITTVEDGTGSTAANEVFVTIGYN